MRFTARAVKLSPPYTLAPMSAQDPSTDNEFDYDVLVVGSGFGGSVTALRLTEKGYRVGVLEAGARFEDQDLPETSLDLRGTSSAPRSAATASSASTRSRTA